MTFQAGGYMHNNSNKIKIYQAHMEKYRKSGLSARKYCSENKINYHTFCYYRKKSSPQKPSLTSEFVQAKIAKTDKDLPTFFSADGSSLRSIDPFWLAQFVRSVWGVK